MPFILTDETAADILIFWMESSDGSISYWEDEAVKEVLAGMDYTMQTYRDTLVHLGALSTERLNKLIEEARAYAAEKYTPEQKKRLIHLLEVISDSDDKGKIEKNKLQQLREEFGLA